MVVSLLVRQGFDLLVGLQSQTVLLFFAEATPASDAATASAATSAITKVAGRSAQAAPILFFPILDPSPLSRRGPRHPAAVPPYSSQNGGKDSNVRGRDLGR